MAGEMKQEIIPSKAVARAIQFVRGQKVVLDRDLAQLDGVTTGNLSNAVRRNGTASLLTSCFN
jgi:hypothetical protein